MNRIIGFATLIVGIFCLSVLPNNWDVGDRFLFGVGLFNTLTGMVYLLNEGS